ncbi:MAG: hypothetical protein AAF593_05770 [Planctomycetota bacterium]
MSGATTQSWRGGVARMLVIAACLALAGCQAAGDRDRVVVVEEKSEAAAPTATQTLTVVDPGLNNMPAARITTPAGWTMEPQVQRPDAAYFSNPVMVDVRVVAPDGRAVRFYPSLVFEHARVADGAAWPLWSATPKGMIAAPPPEAFGPWIVGVIQANPAPGVTDPVLLGEAELPDAQAALEAQHQALLQSYEQLNTTVMSPTAVHYLPKLQARHVSVAYTRHGQPERGDFVLLVLRVDQINDSGVADAGVWKLLAMQSKAGPRPLGEALLFDEELAAVLASWEVQEPWAREIDRFNRALERELTRYQPTRRPELDAAPHDAEFYAMRRKAYAERLDQIIAEAWEEAAAIETPAE